MNKFLIFRTNVNDKSDVASVAPELDSLVDHWNFDLQDIDKILRVQETESLNSQTIVELLKIKGFDCVELN